MTIFVIIAQGENQVLADAIVKNFPSNFLNVAPAQWLVASTGTAKEICDKLEITQGKISGVIVFSVGGYFGRAPNNVWEWISVKLAQPPVPTTPAAPPAPQSSSVNG